MKSAHYSIIIIFIIALISGCSSDKSYTGGKLVAGPAANDIVTYINQGIFSIRELEIKSLESYASVTGENATTDKKLFKTLTDFVVPTYKRFVTGLKNIPVENQEVRQVHAIYIKAAESNLEGFQTIMIGSEKSDVTIIKQGNKKLEEGRAGIEKWNAELNELCKKNGIAFLKDDQNK
ncbi:MAG: hypothetical protein PVG39_12860 [Desulfobacteraceae bacterium]|jgi:hypothetical protein